MCIFGARSRKWCGEAGEGQALGNSSISTRSKSVHFLDCLAIIGVSSTIVAPLTDLTRKSVSEHVSLSIECIQSFSKLKEILLSSAVLRNPDFTRSFILQTDASDVGVGAVLSQQDAEEYHHPVAFFSRKLLSRERRFSTVEKEYLAVKLL